MCNDWTNWSNSGSIHSGSGKIYSFPKTFGLGTLNSITIFQVAYHHALPALLFGCSGILAAILVLFNPETFGKKLPDSIEEAECL